MESTGEFWKPVYNLLEGNFEVLVVNAKHIKNVPGNNESAGKRFSGATGPGNRWLRTSIVQAAWAAIQTKNSYLASFYHRLAGRRGPRRAIFAVAHRMLIAIYHMLTNREAYRDLGAAYLDERDKTNLIKRTAKRFAQLGYQVNIEPLQPLGGA
jgi:transposase